MWGLRELLWIGCGVLLLSRLPVVDATPVDLLQSTLFKKLRSNSDGGGDGDDDGNRGARIPDSWLVGLKPEPSDKLPVPPLLESEDTSLDPSFQDFDKETLLKLLGDKYEPLYMSTRQPYESIYSPNGTLEYDFKNNRRPTGKMPHSIRNMDFSVLHLPEGPNIKTKIGHRLSKKLQRLLWAYTYCPVNYVWKDLGVRFWPRWLREGRCYNGRSCSIPEGMTCKPSGSKYLTLLRWHCQGGRTCQWIPIQYPVITACSCGCKDS
ncbi:noggin [Lingula anatina]|uniref:Noggin n=1 Tax=Lingula anatina TaxID=7574 RepID=A0A1S3JUK8_LINAN|nr:noggin [Lingula anatina]|eukprot:XP_013413781.1 noggin [Lingula anatina]